MINNTHLNIVIPMAGLGSRFKDYGFKENKYLLPIDKKLTKMIEKAITTLNISDDICATFIFILREENNIFDFELREYLKNICIKNKFNYEILSVSELTEGPASTVYIARDLINNDIPLIVSNSDQVLDWNFINFYKKCVNFDGCVLTYNPDYKLILGKNDKNSFVKVNENGNPIEFVEKKVISDQALVGVHYYKKGKYFIEAYNYLFKNNIRAPNNEFYLSYTYQALLDIGGFKIGTYLLNQKEKYYPVGEPNDYFSFYNIYSPIIKYKLNDYQNVNDEFINILNKNNFKIDFQSKNTEIIYNNELLIIITGKINNTSSNIFLTGNNNQISFLEDTYFLRVFNINSTDDILNSININNYIRGWVIGDFEPNIKKIKDFEIGVISHKNNEKWAFHYHNLSTEINVLINGKININNKIIEKNDIFIFEKNVIACPIFLEDCEILCIKIPSYPNDKYII